VGALGGHATYPNLQIQLHWHSASHLAQKQHCFHRSHVERDSGLGDVSAVNLIFHTIRSLAGGAPQ
jgi:hypothetical protein